MIFRSSLLIASLAFVHACSLGENVFSGKGSDNKKEAEASKGSDLVAQQELVDKNLKNYISAVKCGKEDIDGGDGGGSTDPGVPAEEKDSELELRKKIGPPLEECPSEAYEKFSMRICKNGSDLVVSSRPAENEAGHVKIDHGCYFVTCVAHTDAGGTTDEIKPLPAIEFSLKDKGGYKSKIDIEEKVYHCEEVEPINPDEPKEEPVREECKVYQERAQRACTAMAFEKYIRCEASYAPNKDSDKSQLFEAQSDANCDLDGDGGKAHAIDQLNFQICQAGLDNPKPITAKAFCETKTLDLGIED